METATQQKSSKESTFTNWICAAGRFQHDGLFRFHVSFPYFCRSKFLAAIILTQCYVFLVGCVCVSVSCALVRNTESQWSKVCPYFPYFRAYQCPFAIPNERASAIINFCLFEFQGQDGTAQQICFKNVTWQRSNGCGKLQKIKNNENKTRSLTYHSYGLNNSTQQKT